MTDYDYFYEPLFELESTLDHISYPGFQGDEWIIEAKTLIHNYQRYKDEVERGQSLSYMRGTFILNNRHQNIQAYMHVYLQIPYKGTESLRAVKRADQATQAKHNEIVAVKTYDEHRSTITPALYALSEQKQGDDGPIPGGYIVYIVF